MTSLPEQLSAASTRQLSAQLDAQFRFFHTFASQALDNVSRLAMLNLSASRDSVERSAQALRQLTEATGPRDLLALRSHAEAQVRGLVDYNRELFNIGANAQPYGLRTISAQVAAAPVAAAAAVGETLIAETVQQAPEAAVQATEFATEFATESATEAPSAQVEQVEQVQQAAAQTAEPAATPEPFVVEQAEPIASAVEVQSTILDEPVPVSEQKPIAKAVGKGAPKAATAPHPLAAPVEDKDSATVTRIGTSSKRRK